MWNTNAVTKEIAAPTKKLTMIAIFYCNRGRPDDLEDQDSRLFGPIIVITRFTQLTIERFTHFNLSLLSLVTLEYASLIPLTRPEFQKYFFYLNPQLSSLGWDIYSN
jgi:hypothetical protein